MTGMFMGNELMAQKAYELKPAASQVTMLDQVRASIQSLEVQLDRKRKLEKLLAENPAIEECLSLLREF